MTTKRTFTFANIEQGRADVLMNGRPIGQVRHFRNESGHHDPRGTGDWVNTSTAGWSYRDRHGMLYGDAPGQLRGWTGTYRTREDARFALLSCVPVE